jgi:hypothetical protein
MRKSLLMCLAVCVALCAWPGLSAPRDVKSRMKKETGQPTRVEKVPDMRKPFADVIKGFKQLEGLFTFYWDEDSGRAYMEIKPDQLNKIYLCSVTRQAAEAQFFDSAAQMQEFPFIFVKAGQKIEFNYKNVYYRAEDHDPMKRAIERGLSDSMMGSADIISQPNPDGGGMLVDPSSFFLQDIGDVSYVLGEVAKLGYSFDRANSRFSGIKCFPHNCEIETIVHFQSGKPMQSATLPDARSMRHRYHFSLSELQETDYRPRLADDRLGHFTTMYQDYSNVEKETAYVRYINRWHLEKADTTARISPPKEPIVFWLENTIPEEYREAVREGILRWNPAFEKAGFKDAIVVREMPDDADWDPADVRYNTIRWIVNPGGAYAVGPSRANPFTGQIYDADIRISADMVRSVYNDFERLVEPMEIAGAPGSAFDAWTLKWVPQTALSALGIDTEESATLSGAVPPSYIGDWSAGGLERSCAYGIGASREAAFGMSLLSARGALEPDGAKLDNYIKDFIADTVCHEVGHTLGLRHNFKASAVRTLEETEDARLTSKEGLSGSVMDYTPLNLSPKGQRQGQYWQTTLGPYDYWAIEYAYVPIKAATPEEELPVLGKIASRVSEKQLAYGTDEDALAFDPRGIDPTCNLWDLGSDPIDFYAQRVALVKELWSSLEKEFEKPGVRYTELRTVFDRGVRQYMIAGLNCSKYVGGIYARRDHVGDPGNRVPMEPVPAAKQREALEFLKKNFFASDAFEFSADLLNKLAPEREWDLGGSIWRESRLDYPIHDTVLGLQVLPLIRIYNPIVLSRLQDMELKYSGGETPFTMDEMFTGIRDAIWSELGGSHSINSYRRALQRTHLAVLIYFVLSPGGGVPEDARTLARADLVKILQGADRVLGAGAVDSMTRAHLQETKSRIEAALEARLERAGG